MRKSVILFTLLTTISCGSKKADSREVVFDQGLANALEEMAAVDQFAARNAFPPEGYTHLSQEDWIAAKDSIYRSHKVVLEEILNEHGYPGYDHIGKDGEKNYWLMVQHCDFDPEFQTQVLEALQAQVQKDNANARNFGLLKDRVQLNTGQKQIYGTQVTYVQKTGQAIPKPLLDSINVNERRAELGFPPIEVYLNQMTISHFEMNKANLAEHGITEPKLYPTE